ncbi:MAG: hypothetical protein N3G22_01650 [Candidatus Micrarchaeota archaeon]|nr:hypothetical protein [Candidatus Micrarchaeota archaeon]
MLVFQLASGQMGKGRYHYPPGEKKPFNSKKAPLPMFSLLGYADNIVDIVSSKEDKRKRAEIFLEKFKLWKDKAEKELEDEIKKNPSSPRALELENAAKYYDALFAHMVNLTNSFQSLQSRWHAKVDEITAYTSEKLKAGNIFVWMKKWMPWLAGPAVAVGSELTGGWREIVSLVKGLFPQTMQGIGEMAAYLGGLFAMVGISWAVNKLAVFASHRTKLKRDEILDSLLQEEGKVRIAIRAIVQQIALGISAEFGYHNELDRSGDDELKKHALSRDVRRIWAVVNQRINKIRQTLPETIRDLFPASLDLPDYIKARIESQKESLGTGEGQA